MPIPTDRNPYYSLSFRVAWHEAADSTREERRYYVQNWRADVSAVLTDSGKMVEWVKYSAYGVPFALPAGDTDSDSDWDATDAAAIIQGGAYDVRKDAELDGDIDASDAVHANSIAGGYQTLGRGVLSSAAVNNRRGYAGYEYDPTFEGAGRHIYHVRHRVYDADVGRWTRRDPLGYVDWMSLYAYVQGLTVIAADPWGLFICVGGCQPPTPGPISNPGGSGSGCGAGGDPGSESLDDWLDRRLGNGPRAIGSCRMTTRRSSERCRTRGLHGCVPRTVRCLRRGRVLQPVASWATLHARRCWGFDLQPGNLAGPMVRGASRISSNRASTTLGRTPDSLVETRIGTSCTATGTGDRRSGGTSDSA